MNNVMRIPCWYRRLRIRTEDLHPELSKSQVAAVDEIFLSREKIVGLDGVAGAGKTTTLAVIREGVEAQGYRVEGFAPTSRAAQKLSEAGMRTSTLQHHLARGEQPGMRERNGSMCWMSPLLPRLGRCMSSCRAFIGMIVYCLWAMCVSTKAWKLGAHLRSFKRLGCNGKLDEILRQRDPELKQAVELLAHGHVAAAIESLDQQGRVHEVKGREDRIDSDCSRVCGFAREYAGRLAGQPLPCRDQFTDP